MTTGNPITGNVEVCAGKFVPNEVGVLVVAVFPCVCNQDRAVYSIVTGQQDLGVINQSPVVSALIAAKRVQQPYLNVVFTFLPVDRNTYRFGKVDDGRM